jgi:PAS domain S-box-containing protein
MTHPLACRLSRPNAVITITGNGGIVDLNEGAERMFGWRRREALRMPIADLLAAAEARGPKLAELGTALSEDPSRLLDREFELTASGPDGRPFAAELTVARGGLGSPPFLVWIRDISARRVEETESARRFAMLEQAAEVAGIGSYDWDIRTGELRWSDNLFRLFGLDPGAITPTPYYVTERTHADDRDRIRHLTETGASYGRHWKVEFRIVRADGAVRRLQSIVAAVEEEDRVARRFLGTMQDVTERRQIAREIAGHIAIEEVLAAWVSLEDGAERLLAGVGEAMGFAIGVLWLRRDDVLIARSFWRSGSGDGSEFETAARALEAEPGQSLPVEAWLSRQPVVVVSLPDAPPFLGRDGAVRSGLQGAIALPAVSGDLAFAVLEFHSRDRLQPTETLQRSLTGMGYELGHFFARRSGELRPQELTAREVEVLQLAARGMSGKTIAQQLSVSPSTVKTHFEHIYAKWGVSDRASAVAKGLRDGVIQ